MEKQNCGCCTKCLEADIKGFNQFQRAEKNLLCDKDLRVNEIFQISPSKMEKLENLIKDPQRFNNQSRKKKRKEENHDDHTVPLVCIMCENNEQACPCPR